VNIRGKVNPETPRSLSMYLLFTFAFIGMIVLASAYGSYQFFAGELITHAQEDLQGLSRIKAEWIQRELDDSHGDANIFVARPSVWRNLMGINKADESPRLARAIENTLQEGRNYRRILIVDRDFQVIWPANSHRLEPVELSALQEAVKTRDFVLADLHRIEDGVIVYGAAHPVFANDDSNDSVVGAIYLERTAQQNLFPLMAFQFTPSHSSETLLARRDGNDILFLSPLRFRPEALPLSFRLSIDQPTLAKRALLNGEFGLLSGQDYRGVATVGAVQPVSGTPWVVVTKIDRAEIERPARIVGTIILILAVFLLLLLTAFFRLLWRRKTRVMVAERVALAERYAVALHTSIDGYLLVDLTGRIIDVNAALSRMTGYGKAELTTLRIADLEVLETSDEVAAHIARVMTAGNDRFSSQWKRKDGQIIDIDFSVSLTNDHIFAFVQEITQRKQAKYDLRQSESRYRVLIDNAPMCIHEIDMAGKLISMNPSGLRMMGVSDECEVRGLRYLDAVAETHRDRIETLLAKAYAGEASHFEFMSSGPHGLVFQSCFVPIRQGNGTAHGSLILKATSSDRVANP